MAKFTWGIKSGKELQRISPDYTWVRDVSLVEGMKIIMPVYYFVRQAGHEVNIEAPEELANLIKKFRIGNSR